MKIISPKWEFFVICLLIALLALLQSCVHEPLVTPQEGPGTVDPELECDPNIVYFNEVEGILRSNCAKSGCHDATTRKEGVELTSYEKIMQQVEAGDLDDSEIYEMITEDDAEDRMPPPTEKPLTQDQINTIGKWIQQGAQNNYCASESCDTVSVTYTKSIEPLITNKCLGCHSGTTPAGGLNYSTHQGIQAVALDGRLMAAITNPDPKLRMPKGGTLTECQIEMIRLWIEQNAPAN
jgi:uncharacterized membrane protein